MQTSGRLTDMGTYSTAASPYAARLPASLIYSQSTSPASRGTYTASTEVMTLRTKGNKKLSHIGVPWDSHQQMPDQRALLNHVLHHKPVSYFPVAPLAAKKPII